MSQHGAAVPGQVAPARARRRRRGSMVVLGVLVVVALSLLGTPSAGAAPLPGDSGHGRRIVYSVGQQRVWWVEADGRVAHTYLVSGRAGTPRTGTYQVYSKSRYTTSIDGSSRMEFMVRFTWGHSAAIGFHSIPVNSRGVPLQSEAQLGTYQSAGCIRQRYSDAQGLYNWAPVGTTVVVVK